MLRLGIHYDFAPGSMSITTPIIPISADQASFSADIAAVEANALLASEGARAQRIGLCLKHFPGIGGAAVDSHQEFMDISMPFGMNRWNCSIRSRQRCSAMRCGQPCHREAGTGIAR